MGSIESAIYVEVSKATHSVCREIAARYAHERLYSFNLYTHPELSYVGDNFSTEIGLEKVAKEYVRLGHRFSLAELRWSPPDSPYHAMFHERFEDANRLFNSYCNYNKLSDAEYERRYTAIRDIFVEVLMDIRNARIFDSDIALNFVCGDQSYEERLVSAEHINHVDVLKNYQSGLELDFDCVNRLRRAWFRRDNEQKE
jgi:hypothetical protein